MSDYTYKLIVKNHIEIYIKDKKLNYIIISILIIMLKKNYMEGYYWIKQIL